MISKEKIFAARREDLAFDFAHGVDEVFSFATFKNDDLSTNEGIMYSENLGYDFQNECSPKVGIKPLGTDLLENIGIEANQFVFNITLEDRSLGIRCPIFVIPASDVEEELIREINLTEQEGMSFHGGFEVKCFLSRQKTETQGSHQIWHKSQVIFQKTFTVKASVDEAIFEIEWQDFSSDDDKKDVLYFINWRSAEVSNSIDKDCFQVKANARLKKQFKRLENNKHFGTFCIRMIADQILKELLQKTLRNAVIDKGVEPLKDSLHDRFAALLKKLGYDFEELAKGAQSTSKLEQLDADTRVEKILQKITTLGSTLENIKFGGYR